VQEGHTVLVVSFTFTASIIPYNKFLFLPDNREPEAVNFLKLVGKFC